MTVKYSKQFKKQFKKLRKSEKERFWDRLEIFLKNPDSKILKLHKLKGSYSNYYSISIGGDLRALFIEKDEDLILFELIGTHSQLYG